MKGVRFRLIVIPAKAGIHVYKVAFFKCLMDPRIREDDAERVFNVIVY